MKRIVPFIAALLISLVSDAQMVLNEVYTDPGSNRHEFFELYNSNASATPETLDGYTLVAYYEEGGQKGFYVLDFPSVNINAKEFCAAAAAQQFNVQGQQNLTATINWNNLPSSGSLTKWQRSGSTYVQVAVPASLNDLFVKKTGTGANYHIFLFNNGVLVNALLGGISSQQLPDYIRTMPVLAVDMAAPTSDFTINFNSLIDYQLEFVDAATGSDNGYTRLTDGKCGAWQKSSSQVQHTPSKTNGSAAGEAGSLTINSVISYGSTTATLNYEITAGPESAFPVKMEAYRDFGLIGVLDGSDQLFDSRFINNTTAGVQTLNLVHVDDKVILCARTAASCFDKVMALEGSKSTLPVRLRSFNAFLVNGKVDLKWSTSSEINASHFQVEKSFDGRQFSSLGTVFAVGSAHAVTNYNFSDNLSGNSAKVIYYRLRSVDQDGKSELSATRIIRITEKAVAISVQTFPNPVTDLLKVTVPAGWQNKSVEFRVVAVNGQTVRVSLAANCSQTETVNVSDLHPGVYFVKVSCGTESAMQRIIKN
ncbi:MAG TPA: T9SS type A sorting domain-containing protein [Chitinophagaceae bacterium]|nr:T9SS type A sorting domain-containing protein [Chitinophagaceae bacterium]